MNINFTKMHGLGNDFVVINGITQSLSLTPEQIRFIADRNLGVGCDQLLLVEKSDKPDADFRYRIYNGDGSEVEHCGNGARCFATFVREEGLTNKTTIPVITNNGHITLNVEDGGAVTVDMGTPILKPVEIPFLANSQATTYTLDINGKAITMGVVSVGNPHAVILVDNIDTAPVEKIGMAIQADKHFPNSVNVGFMQIINQHTIKLRVYERGMGETQACGTGACAAVTSGRLQGLLGETIDVHLLGGKLSISWAGDKNPVMMTGPTVTVFKGNITL